jgi:hypothetical protein
MKHRKLKQREGGAKAPLFFCLLAAIKKRLKGAFREWNESKKDRLVWAPCPLPSRHNHRRCAGAGAPALNADRLQG